MRIYSLHFLLPFVLLSISIYHMLLLHVEGSSSPIGIENFDYLSFYPYFIIKDLFAIVFILFTIPMVNHKLKCLQKLTLLTSTPIRKEPRLPRPRHQTPIEGPRMAWPRFGSPFRTSLHEAEFQLGTNW
mgnify:CR=1 FL=1